MHLSVCLSLAGGRRPVERGGGLCRSTVLPTNRVAGKRRGEGRRNRVGGGYCNPCCAACAAVGALMVIVIVIDSVHVTDLLGHALGVPNARFK